MVIFNVRVSNFGCTDCMAGQMCTPKIKSLAIFVALREIFELIL